jgi:hypothetical protein
VATLLPTPRSEVLASNPAVFSATPTTCGNYGGIMDKSILSLCLVNTLWHKYKKTYVDNFVPLMATTLLRHNYHKIENKDIENLVEDFTIDFGIHLTRNPALTILQKCKKNNIVRSSGRTYFTDESIAMRYDISKEITTNTEKQTELFIDFKKFYEAETAGIISDDVVSNLILNFIINNDVGIFMISEVGDSANLLPNPKLPHNYKRYKYIFDKYVSKIYTENKDVFRILVEVALGSIATNALLFSFANQSGLSIKNCNIYLDTSLILQLVGADEKENSDGVSLLLDSIRSNGANLKIYEHTYHESIESLETGLRWVESLNFDPTKANRTTLYFRQEGYRKSDIELIIASFDRKLRENNISIEQVPVYTYETTLIDEKRLQQLFEEEVSKRDKTFQRENYMRRTLRDVASICATSRLRYGKKYIKTIKDAGHLFVTTNGALSYANYRYNAEYRRNKHCEIPECVSDVFLGTYLWANTPQIANDINYFKIIAIALSAIKPDSEMEKTLQLEAKKLLDDGRLTSDDYAIVTSSHLIKSLVSDRYFANAGTITETSIYSILDEVKERLIGNKDTEITELNEKFHNEKIRREETEEKIRQSENQYKALRVKLETKANLIASNKASGYAYGLKALLLFLIVAPLLPAFFISKLFMLISGISATAMGWFSIKGYTFDVLKEKIHKAVLLKERKKFVLDEFDHIETTNAP